MPRIDDVMNPVMHASPSPYRFSTFRSALSGVLLIALFACPSVRAQVFSETDIRDPMSEFQPEWGLETFPLAFHSTSVGDLDGDGYGDIALSDGITEEIIHPFRRLTHGAVWIAFMQPRTRTGESLASGGSPVVRHRRSIEASELGITTPYVFGHALAGLGDLDGDGNSELAVSSWSDGRHGTSAGGELYVLFLNDDGSVKRYTEIVAPPWSGSWGRTMTSMGDLDGDGSVELAISADPASPGGGARVVLVSINPDGSLLRSNEITSQIEAYHDYEAEWTYLANAGDINGDGVDDLVSGDILDQDFGSGTGSFYVVFLDQDGDVIDVPKQRNIEDFFFEGDGDQFGHAIAPLGDLDGDGVPDLVVGAPGDDDGATDSGAVWLLAMNRDGSVKDYQKFTFFARDVGGQLGWGLGALGDLNGDGRSEIGIMANWRGYQIVTFTPTSLTAEGADDPLMLSSVGHGNLLSRYNFGAAVQAVGDLQHRGVTFPVVASGAPHDDEGQISGGAVYLLYMKSAADESFVVEHGRKIVPGVKGVAEQDQTEPGDIIPPCRSRDRKANPKAGNSDRTRPDRTPLCPQNELKQGDLFGQAVALLGDIDGNSVRDLAVGAPGNGGAVWVFRLELNGVVQLHARIDAHTPGVNGAAGAEAEFGHSVAYLGDMDSDGSFELAVGIPGKDAVIVLSVRPDGTVSRVRQIRDGEGGVPVGAIQENSRFGHALGTADVTGDGRLELLVGAPLYDEPPGQIENAIPDAGAVYILSLNDDAEAVPPLHRISRLNGLEGAFGSDAPANGDQFGWSVSGTGDVDRDGREDIIVGAPEKDMGKGAAYIVRLDAASRVSGGFFLAEGSGGLQGPLSERGDRSFPSADRFGSAVAPIVVDRNGLLELAVGAEGEWVQNAGAVWFLRTQLLDDDEYVQNPVTHNSQSGAADAALSTSDLPEAHVLGASYPNPANTLASIKYGLHEADDVRLEVFDILGRSVVMLVDGRQQAGWHEVLFDGADLPSGTYFFKLNAGPFTQTRSMVLLK